MYECIYIYWLLYPVAPLANPRYAQVHGRISCLHASLHGDIKLVRSVTSLLPLTPPNHFVVRKLENTDGGGVGAPHQCPLGLQ